MKYIFLDIDGVLNTKSSWKIPYMINPTLVARLGKITEDTDGKIILTSTWKTGFEKELDTCTPQIKALRLKMQDCGYDIWDKCPELKGRTRDKEIERYLYFNPSDKYVILDDDTSLYDVKNNLLVVNCETGITEKDVEKAKKMLK